MPALEHLYGAMQGASGKGGGCMTRSKWAWWMAFLSSHPSDFAFDFVSKTLRGDSE
jgi:hypothetical protein